jgi:hypothetical protein
MVLSPKSYLFSSQGSAAPNLTYLLKDQTLVESRSEATGRLVVGCGASYANLTYEKTLTLVEARLLVGSVGCVPEASSSKWNLQLFCERIAKGDVTRKQASWEKVKFAATS